MAQIFIDIPLSALNQVRGVAGQQLQIFESKSGCSCCIFRKQNSAAVRVSSSDIKRCELAKTMIEDFVRNISNRVSQESKPAQTSITDPVSQGPSSLPAGNLPAVPRPIPAAIKTPQISNQKSITVSMVEIPLSGVDEVSSRKADLEKQTGCVFEVLRERYRGLVKISHPEMSVRRSAREYLNNLLTSLSPQTATFTSSPEKIVSQKNVPIQNRELKTLQNNSGNSSRRGFTSNYNGNSRTAALDGWDSPITTDNENTNKSPKKVVKNFYREHPDVQNMSDLEVASYRREHMEIKVDYLGTKPLPSGIPKPVREFEHAFHDFPEILRQLQAKFESPSPIQSQSWPILLSGHDMVGIAQTGTGKTLAFLLPAFIHIRGQSVTSLRYEGPSCLVLSPTRELAIQIYEEVCKYAYQGIKSACCYGGASRNDQMSRLRSNPEIIIATPGRLNDLIDSMVVSMKRVSYLVLDEADRMLDMGFEPQIQQILQHIPKNRQTVMTSATWPKNVRNLSSRYLQQPIQVTIGSLDLRAAATVTQRVRMVRKEEKLQLTLNLTKSLGPSDRAIIFCGRKITAEKLAENLRINGVPAEVIHGDRSQREREAALRHLKVGKSRILVATDVASRGLDVPEVSVVLNFDFPTNIEEYVHRVGRTGRAGKLGSSYTMMTSQDTRFARELVEILRKANQQVPDWLVKLQGGSGKGFFK